MTNRAPQSPFWHYKLTGTTADDADVYASMSKSRAITQKGFLFPEQIKKACVSVFYQFLTKVNICDLF